MLEVSLTGTFSEKKQPYEFLARWGTDGKLTGAHVQWCACLYHNGAKKTEEVGPAEKVAVGVGLGFPLKDIMDQLTADAIVRGDELDATVKARDATIQARDAEIAGLKQTVAQRDATIVALQAQIAEKEAA